MSVLLGDVTLSLEVHQGALQQQGTVHSPCHPALLGLPVGEQDSGDAFTTWDGLS